MSIYISGLDMPTNEGGKTFTVYPDGTVTEPNWQWDTKLIVGAKAQQIGPHGRLVDADNIERKLVELIEYKYNHGSDFFASGMDAARIMLYEEPTIIE